MQRASSLEKILRLGKIEDRRKEKGAIEDEMIGLSAHEFRQTPGDSEGRGNLACCSPWDSKKLDMD